MRRTAWILLFLLALSLPGRKSMYQITVDDYSVGGVYLSDGTGNETDNAQRAKTDYWPLGTIRVQWDPKAGVQYLIIYYDENYDVLKSTEFQARSKTITGKDVSGAAYVRFIFRQEDEQPFPEAFQLPEGCSIEADSALQIFHDQPENEGVKNVLLRAKQCLDLSYTTKAVLPAQKGDLNPGTEVKGVIYSSTRKESLYVPNAVSFETYLTALHNHNSYIYTRISELANSRTYYGMVCSSFISYCYDLPCVYTTGQLGTLKEFERIGKQDVDHLELGDMLLKVKDHVGIVTGIDRDESGRVLRVSVTDSAKPTTRVRTFSRKGFAEKWLKNKFVIYRYSEIASVPFAYSLWADEGFTPRYNENLSPRRGDKANWPLGERVEIDVLDSKGYDRAELYRDGVRYVVQSIPKNRCLRYEGLPSGKYEVYLTKGKHRSQPASFMVVDTMVEVEALGNGQVKISFASSNATPKWYAWCCTDEAAPAWSEDGRNTREGDLSNWYLATWRAYALTDEDRSQGFVISREKPGKWHFKVEFETEYGVISSRFADVEVY